MLLLNSLNLHLLFNFFWPNIKRFWYKNGIQFNYTALVVEQNKYATKIVNVYIANELDYWPRNLVNNFAFKIFLFGATNAVKNSDEC